ncbi:hypothetical protein [Terrimicrobium sacchariphilum]|nr:hypothetical protein [Terrimicrobium sacchariphilum]
MSVQSETNRVQYWGNGTTTTAYPVPFYFFEIGDLRVVVTDAEGADIKLAEGSDYSVSGAGNESGGAIWTVAAVPPTSRVTIYREVQAVQSTVYEENGEFPAKTHERALDRQTMLSQQNARALGQALKVRESDGEKSPLTTVTNSVIGFGGDAQPRTFTPEQLAVWLNLTQQFFGEGTKTWLMNSDRTSVVPEFLGQVGVQLEDFTIWVATGTSAGAWVAPKAGIPDNSILTTMLANGVLSADSAGRAKMSDSFLTLAKIGSGIFTADAAGRGKFGSGFVDSSLCASGLWNAIAPVGAIIQTVGASSNAETTLSAQIPFGNAKPQISDGTQVISVSITPILSSSKIRVQYNGPYSASSATGACFAIFRSGVNDCLVSSYCSFGSGDYGVNVNLDMIDVPGGGVKTYSIRVGPVVSSVIYLNRLHTYGSKFGGSLAQVLTVQEIKG